ncbi:hypothetical protein PspLS_02091 [Pyricularia sp. CBS 133598]|nr:hypothetical protein PspLS_02091 [Pyricularia sp. CBS 133598]
MKAAVILTLFTLASAAPGRGQNSGRRRTGDSPTARDYECQLKEPAGWDTCMKGCKNQMTSIADLQYLYILCQKKCQAELGLNDLVFLKQEHQTRFNEY